MQLVSIEKGPARAGPFFLMRRRAPGLAGQQWDEVFDRLAEFTSVRTHREVDGVEVGFAAEATAEIRARIHRRLALLAARTDEHEVSVPRLARPTEMLDQPCHRNVVA